jgi:hypothetical protein
MARSSEQFLLKKLAMTIARSVLYDIRSGCAHMHERQAVTEGKHLGCRFLIWILY